MLVYDDVARSDEDTDADFGDLEGSQFRGHGHSQVNHRMPIVEMVAPATTQEDSMREEKEKKGE